MKNKLSIETRVRNLSKYLEEIEKGTIQIPSFQRDYVWNRDRIKDLFDSIKNKYPIGSILLWQPGEVIGKNKETIGSYYIPKNELNPIYILDGFQRLSTLFGCLTNPSRTELRQNNSEWEEAFNLFYDLEEEVFTYIRPKTESLPYQIPVYTLMNTSDFRQYTRKKFEMIEDEKKIEIYYNRADRLSATLLDYQIACIDISNATIEEAVEIFSRINSKGQDISLDWMANALSSRDDFRFGDEIDNLLDELQEYNFHKISRNAIFRCIQSSFNNKFYIDNSDIAILAKRKDFSDVTKFSIPKIKQAVEFLYKELLVLDSRLLPYNLQLIFVMDFFKKFETPTEKQKESLKEWFWITTYSNYFTMYSLSGWRKAYYHFQNFLIGKELNPVYNDNPQLKFSVTSFPDKINMGSVRSKALTLFQLNYAYQKSKQYNPIGYTLQKLFASNYDAANYIPIIEFEGGVKLKKSKDLSSWLESSIVFDDIERHFISEEMINLYQNNSINENIQKRMIELRRKLIEKHEKAFTEHYNLEYNFS